MKNAINMDHNKSDLLGKGNFRKHWCKLNTNYLNCNL